MQCEGALLDGSNGVETPRYSPRQRQPCGMAEHCDKCGTELDPSQARHQLYQIEHASDSVDTLEGRLCSDCFWEFKEWLQTEEVT
jgi:hypothetical protein